MFLIIIAPYFGSATCFFWPRCKEMLASGYSASVACAQNTGGLDPNRTRARLLIVIVCARRHIYGSSDSLRATSAESSVTEPRSLQHQRSPRPPLLHSYRGTYVSHMFCHLSVSSFSFYPPKKESDLLFLQQQSFGPAHISPLPLRSFPPFITLVTCTFPVSLPIKDL